MASSFITRILSRFFAAAAVETPSQDVRLLIRSLKHLGATLVVDKEFANKRVLVFNAPKVRTGEFPFRFFRVTDNGTRVVFRPSKIVVDSFKEMGYTAGPDIGRGQSTFTKGKHRVQIGAPASSNSGETQGLVVSFERLA